MPIPRRRAFEARGIATLQERKARPRRDGSHLVVFLHQFPKAPVLPGAYGRKLTVFARSHIRKTILQTTIWAVVKAIQPLFHQTPNPRRLEAVAPLRPAPYFWAAQCRARRSRPGGSQPRDPSGQACPAWCGEHASILLRICTGIERRRLAGRPYAGPPGILPCAGALKPIGRRRISRSGCLPQGSSLCFTYGNALAAAQKPLPCATSTRPPFRRNSPDSFCEVVPRPAP